MRVNAARWPRRDTGLLAICAALVMAAGVLVAVHAVTASAAPQLRVSGNQLVDSAGQPVVLHGVDLSGTEYQCVQNRGIFSVPANQASIAAMKRWDINAVRIPLNEACWNGEGYVNRAYAGARYRSAIAAYVKLLNSSGMYVVLDLHWSDGQYTGNSAGCTSAEATCQKPMPDQAEAEPFWSSVASMFKGNDAVIFDLFNEPYPDNALPAQAAWTCWRDGGPACSPGISYAVAGMQTLVNVVRGAGADNVIMLAGLAYANDLTQWLAFEPADPDHNLVASWHSYSFNACSTRSCWASQVAPVMAKVPVIAGEIGESGGTATYLDELMNYLDSKSAGYLAWSWNADTGQSPGLDLITDYHGDPTAYGQEYKSHLESLAQR